MSDAILKTILDAGVLVLIAAAIFIDALRRFKGADKKTTEQSMSEAMVSLATVAETQTDVQKTQTTILREIEVALNKNLETDRARNDMMIAQTVTLNKLTQLTETNVSQIGERNQIVATFDQRLTDSTAVVRGVGISVDAQLGANTAQMEVQGGKLMELSISISQLKDTFESELRSVNAELKTISSTLKLMDTTHQNTATETSGLRESIDKISAKVDALPDKFKQIVSEIEQETSAKTDNEPKKET